MTVLGNIVAVTSIIAVVVAHPGTQRVGAGRDPQPGRRRLVQRPAVSDHASATRSSSEFRYNPRITAADARAIQRYSPLVVGGHARVERQRRRSSTATSRSTACSIQGVSVGVQQLLDLQRRAGPADERHRSRRDRAGRPDRLGHRRSPVRRRRSAGQDHPDRRRPLPRRRRERQARIVSRPVAGRLRRDPARPVPADLRLAAPAVA